MLSRSRTMLATLRPVLAAAAAHVRPRVTVSRAIRTASDSLPLSPVIATRSYTKRSKLGIYESEDLTDRARQGKLDPVIGREEEIRRTIQILSRRTKTVPVLVGSPGTGKMAILEGVAQRIVNREVPDSMGCKRIISLDLALLAAGTGYPGEFEERLKAEFNRLLSGSGGVILFIDDLHKLVRPNIDTQEYMDNSNILKSMLAGGRLQCVGAATPAEYRRIEKDVALARLFQPVSVNEPTLQDTIGILRGIKDRYELHHGVRITDSALVAAATLSDRYITDRFLPGKAVDLVDEAASAVRLQQEPRPNGLQELDRAILIIRSELKSLRKELDVVYGERRRELKSTLKEKQSQLNEFTKRWQKECAELYAIRDARECPDEARIKPEQARRKRPSEEIRELQYPALDTKEAEMTKGSSIVRNFVDGDDIARVISESTGIPTARLMSGEIERFMHMEDTLRLSVRGQDEALKAISDAVRLQRAGLTPPHRPIASFMFIGPTGVGKTELCKKTAEFLFSTEQAVVRFDMSEFQEEGGIARLIGSPPGHVGYQDGGQLTEAIRRKPYAILLFDNFEKADCDMSSLLLRVLDEGCLADARGIKVDFSSTIIVFALTTSFGQDGLIGVPPSDTRLPETKQAVMRAVQRLCIPELVNRVDDLIIFSPLSRGTIREIVDIRLKELQGRLEERGIVLEVDGKAKSWLAEKGYNVKHGARPLNTLIMKEVSERLANMLIAGQIRNGMTAGVTLGEGSLEIQGVETPETEVEDESQVHDLL